MGITIVFDMIKMFILDIQYELNLYAVIPLNLTEIPCQTLNKNSVSVSNDNIWLA